MEELIIVVKVAVSLGLIIFGTIMCVVLPASRRAYKTKPIRYIPGMVVCTKTSKIIGLRTPVYQDPKHGGTYKGFQQRLTNGVWQ